MSASSDAALALLVARAMDMYEDAGAANLSPPAQPAMSAEWTLKGYLTGVDAIYRQGASLCGGQQRVFYGYVAESIAAPGEFVAVIRGTDGILEWIEDAEFALEPHPVAGQVEAGFAGIYRSMLYRSLSSRAAAAQPLVSGIANEVGTGRLTVIGHSLGAALATYLALDLAGDLPSRLTCRLFASPRPGDQAFADLFAARIADCVAYAYELDLVPKVPMGMGYCPLNSLVHIQPSTAQARISFNFGCFHHVLCYAAMLDYKIANWSAVPEIDRPLAACIKGPAT